MTTCTYIVSKKAKQYSAEARRNPAFAAISLAATLNPNVEVVAKDGSTGKITLRNKKTGQVVTFDTTQYTADNAGRAFEAFAARMQAGMPAEPSGMSAGGAASAGQAAALTEAVRHFPAFVSEYPGGEVTNADQQTVGPTLAGNYEFTTADPPGQVADFYQKKLGDAGFRVVTRHDGTNERGATAMMVATSTDARSMVTINIEAGADGRAHANLSFTANNGP